VSWVSGLVRVSFPGARGRLTDRFVPDLVDPEFGKLPPDPFVEFSGVFHLLVILCIKVNYHVIVSYRDRRRQKVVSDLISQYYGKEVRGRRTMDVKRIIAHLDRLREPLIGSAQGFAIVPGWVEERLPVRALLALRWEWR
jgi:hypothetical protein